MYLSFFLKLASSHHYYLIPLFLTAIPLYLYGAHLVEKYILKKRAKLFIQFLLVLFLGLNIYNAKVHMQVRYYGRTMNYKEHPAFYKDAFREYLLKQGVGLDAKIVSYPDPSMNNTLYLMRRRGWSSLGIGKIHAPYVNFIRNSGAQFLVLNDTAYRTDTILMPLLDKRIGSFEGIDIYDLSE
jgi:hypothetical protein